MSGQEIIPHLSSAEAYRMRYNEPATGYVEWWRWVERRVNLLEAWHRARVEVEMPD